MEKGISWTDTVTLNKILLHTLHPLIYALEHLLYTNTNSTTPPAVQVRPQARS